MRVRKAGVSLPRVFELGGFEAEAGPSLLKALANLGKALVDAERRHEELKRSLHAVAHRPPSIRCWRRRTLISHRIHWPTLARWPCTRRPVSTTPLRLIVEGMLALKLTR